MRPLRGGFAAADGLLSLDLKSVFELCDVDHDGAAGDAEAQDYDVAAAGDDDLGGRSADGYEADEGGDGVVDDDGDDADDAAS